MDLIGGNMEKLMAIYNLLPEIFTALFALIVAAELIARLTPTKKDDGAVERVGSFIRKVADFLKIPNIKK